MTPEKAVETLRAFRSSIKYGDVTYGEVVSVLADALAEMRTERAERFTWPADVNLSTQTEAEPYRTQEEWKRERDAVVARLGEVQAERDQLRGFLDRLCNEPARDGEDWEVVNGDVLNEARAALAQTKEEG